MSNMPDTQIMRGKKNVFFIATFIFEALNQKKKKSFCDVE